MLKHGRARAWLVTALDGEEPVARRLPVVSGGFVLVSTSPRVFDPQSTHAEVYGFIRSLTGRATTLWLNPARQHLRHLERLRPEAEVRGDLVSDAVIAALALEAGATVVSWDRDFARFAGLS